MIRIRISDRWRIRRSEWMLSLCTLAIGLVYLYIPGLFQPRWFSPMLAIASQQAWGVGAVSIGGLRIALLLINGAWRASPHLRCIGAQMSCVLWLTLFVTAISADGLVQSVGFWALFFFFDALSAMDAAGDARMADEKARATRARARDAGGS